MKKQLKLIRLCLFFSLLLTFSCSNEDSTISDNEEPTLEKIEIPLSEIEKNTVTVNIDGLEDNELSDTINYDILAKETNPNSSNCNRSGLNPGSGQSGINSLFGNSKYKITDLPQFTMSSQDVNDASGLSQTRTIDDRTCAFNYSQVRSTAGSDYGVYKLKSNSNPFDDLQPRIERAGVTISSNLNPGTRTELNGTVVIRRVGYTGSGNPLSVGDNNGTYICQAKGKFGGNSKDPAILLLLVKATNNTQSRFRFYLERIDTRRTLSGGRVIEDLNFEVDANTEVNVKLVNEFVSGSNSCKVHRIRTELRSGRSSVNNTYVVPDADAADDIKVRFGAYRCKGGQADIMWKSNVRINNTINTNRCTNNNTSRNNGNWDPANSITNQAINFYSSSNWSNSYLPNFIGDNNIYTRWASGQNNSSNVVYAQFSGNRVVRRAKVMFNAAYSSDFTLYGYYNGSWYALSNINNSGGSQDVKIEGFYSNASIYAILSRNGPYNHISIKELQLYPN